MKNEFDSTKAELEFMSAAKKSIETKENNAKVKKVKSKIIKENDKSRRRKNPEDELKKMFVKASTARKLAKEKKSETPGDEYVIRENAEMVLTDASYNYRFAYFKLQESINKNKLLTGEIQSIEEVGGYWTAIIFMDQFKVMIPIFEFLDVNINIKTDTYSEDARVMMSKRLGSTIDFIVKHMDEKSGIVVGSRIAAMDKKAKFFYKKKFDDEFLINEGDIVKARVVATSRPGLNIEIMGVEVFVPSREVSYNYVVDSSKYYSVGDEVDAKVLKIFESEDGHIEVEASIAAVKEDAYNRIKNQIIPGKKYVGEIIAINNYGVFVHIVLGECPIDVLCAYPSFGNMPTVGANVTINITDKNEKGFYGIIQHLSLA